MKAGGGRWSMTDADSQVAVKMDGEGRGRRKMIAGNDCLVEEKIERERNFLKQRCEEGEPKDKTVEYLETSPLTL